MNREVTEEKHNLCPSWKPPHNLKVGIGDINTFSVKTKGSCKNNHPLYKPEFKEDVSFCCLCQGKSTSTLSSGQRSPAHFTGWGWWGLEEGRRLWAAAEEMEENTARSTSSFRNVIQFTLKKFPIVIPHLYSCKIVNSTIHVVL